MPKHFTDAEIEYAYVRRKAHCIVIAQSFGNAEVQLQMGLTTTYSEKPYSSTA